MKDGIGREINYIRVSVTERCNLRCKYCMPDDGIKKSPARKYLDLRKLKI